MITKSKEFSDELRLKGNQFYSQRKFFDALMKYNESLCFAGDSESAGHAYANKSACYFEMKLYERCLNTIKMAKENKYPESNWGILEKRQEKCMEMMKNISNEKPSNPWTFFKLSYPPNKNIPHIIDCLKVESSQQYGRFVTAGRQLKVGDIIAMEKPFCSVLMEKSTFGSEPESNIYQRCTNCLKENELDLIPCEICSKAMFCSLTCRDEAMNRFHSFECPIINQLLASSVTHLSIRQFFVALSMFNGSVQALKNFIEENEDKNFTIFDFDSNSDDSEKNRLIASRSLIRTKKIFSMAKHEEILRSHPTLSILLKDHFDFVKNFLMWQRQISDLNFLGVFSGHSRKIQSNEKVDILNSLQQPVGIGSLLFGSFVNHSCSNNVFRVCAEGKLIYIVCRPIEKGAQIFDSYKTSFVNELKPSRQERLLKEFEFLCSCDACTLNFQTPPVSKDPKLLKFAKKLNDDILTLHHGAIIKSYKNCSESLEKFNKNFPSLELCFLQKCLVTLCVKLAQPKTIFP